MVTRILLPLAAFFCLSASPLLARQDPTPPPSGVTIHLFGGGTAGMPALTAPQIFHQMFVTGDPDMTPARKRAAGKTGEIPRPSHPPDN